MIRLNKYIADSGYCSRRQADRLILEQKVNVDGEIAFIGQTIDENSVVKIGEKIISQSDKKLILVFNKPKGVVCTSAKIDKRNVIDYLKLDCRVFTVGRLDKDSEGLLLLTNNGEIVNKIMRAGNYHEKEYIVTLNRSFDDLFLNKMSKGVHIYDKEKGIDTVTRPCICKRINEKSFSIILTQGINRQIRRMCQALSYEVIVLKRSRIMNIGLGNLKTGEYRNITFSEQKKLFELIKYSKK